MIKRRYSDLIKFDDLESRYSYLKLVGRVGKETFGWDRHVNQVFYHTSEWKRVRDIVIVRDNGCDLGVINFEIPGKILIHHMNPIWVDDIRNRNPDILDPEFLISTSERTHQAIHYGDKNLLPSIPKQRLPGDTKLW